MCRLSSKGFVLLVGVSFCIKAIAQRQSKKEILLYIIKSIDEQPTSAVFCIIFVQCSQSLERPLSLCRCLLWRANHYFNAYRSGLRFGLILLSPVPWLASFFDKIVLKGPELNHSVVQHPLFSVGLSLQYLGRNMRSGCNPQSLPG